jgi:hypothetical protein
MMLLTCGAVQPPDPGRVRAKATPLKNATPPCTLTGEQRGTSRNDLTFAALSSTHVHGAPPDLSVLLSLSLIKHSPAMPTVTRQLSDRTFPMPLTATLAPVPDRSAAGEAARRAAAKSADKSGEADSIPPDLASFLCDAPAHPALFRPLPPAPHAAALTQAALSLAAMAMLDAEAAALAGPPQLPPNTRGTIHMIGRSGVLHLPAQPAIRAISLGYGTLTQRNSALPSLRPGAVRLIPAHREVILAELHDQGALAVEIAL